MFRLAINQIIGFLRLFAVSQSGNVVIMTAIVFPILFVLVGGGIEYSKVLGQRDKLQQYADQAALAAAKELERGGRRRCPYYGGSTGRC